MDEAGRQLHHSEVARGEVMASNRIAFAVAYRDVGPTVGDKLPRALERRFKCRRDFNARL